MIQCLDHFYVWKLGSQISNNTPLAFNKMSIPFQPTLPPMILSGKPMANIMVCCMTKSWTGHHQISCLHQSSPQWPRLTCQHVPTTCLPKHRAQDDINIKCHNFLWLQKYKNVLSKGELMFLKWTHQLHNECSHIAFPQFYLLAKVRFPCPCTQLSQLAAASSMALAIGSTTNNNLLAALSSPTSRAQKPTSKGFMTSRSGSHCLS